MTRVRTRTATCSSLQEPIFICWASVVKLYMSSPCNSPFITFTALWDEAAAPVLFWELRLTIKNIVPGMHLTELCHVLHWVAAGGSGANAGLGTIHSSCLHSVRAHAWCVKMSNISFLTIIFCILKKWIFFCSICNILHSIWTHSWKFRVPNRKFHLECPLKLEPWLLKAEESTQPWPQDYRWLCPFQQKYILFIILFISTVLFVAHLVGRTHNVFMRKILCNV